MYKEAEEQISKGLSPFSRFLLGSVAGLFGVMMILIAPPTDKEIYFYIFGGFCLVICLGSDQSIFNAILFGVFFGVPGFTYAVKTKFGFARKSPNK